MALSRLRHPLISRAPSLLKARLLSSSYASSRSLYGPASLPLLTGVHDNSLELKWVGVKFFSSSG